jgi:YHS domain-containing protein
MITRKELKGIGEAIEVAIKPLEKVLGMKLEYAGGQYGPEAIVKIRAQRYDENGVLITSERTNFQADAPSCGIPIDALDSTFEFKGATYRVSGVKISREKSLVAEQLENGKTYFFSPSVLKQVTLKKP